jgi:hypothetical protein
MKADQHRAKRNSFSLQAPTNARDTSPPASLKTHSVYELIHAFILKIQPNLWFSMGIVLVSIKVRD